MKLSIDGREVETDSCSETVKRIANLLQKWIEEFAPVEEQYMKNQFAIQVLKGQLGDAIRQESKIVPVGSLSNEILKKA